MEGRNDSAPLGDLGPIDNLNDDDDDGALFFPEKIMILSSKTNYFGLFLILIPLITILGNLLVIVSVLRFKALHSAINFLILGLAVADLLVALFVMPYAVYVHVQNGEWFLGNLMCDIYMASDVACSTASILLLAVISFDRYRAVSRPIQYSRQAQNIKRVFIILGFIWLISLTLASPIVFGVNMRPANANPLECRMYNAPFSIGSSIISFVIPCILVLFVYIRIMIALKKREQAAKMRRISQLQQSNHSSQRANSSVEEDEAGRIVAGPVVNVMMLALPSMSKRMRRFERHQAAIQAAGECLEGLEDESATASEPPSPGGTTMIPLSRRPRAASALPLFPLRLASTPTQENRRRRMKEKDCCGGSSTPRSSIDSLSDNVHVVTNDFVSEGCPSRRSSENPDSSIILNSKGEFEEKMRKSRSSKRFKNFARNYSTRSRRRSLPGEAEGESKSLSPRGGDFFPSLMRQLSMRSPRLFRSAIIQKANKTEPVIMSNPLTTSPHHIADSERPTTSVTDNETMSTSIPRCSEIRNCSRLGDIQEGTNNTSFSRSTTVNSELFGSPEQIDPNCSFVNENKTASTSSPQEDSQPTVTFSMTVRALASSPGQTEEDKKLKGSFDEGHRRSQDIVRILTRNSISEAKTNHKESCESRKLSRLDSMCSSSEKSRNNSLKSTDSRNQSVKKLVETSVRFIDDESLSDQRSNGGLAVRLVKKTMKHEQSLKRKVSKSQRKERRATKTLGIVVGIFLVCWVPFFSINILNAVCDILNKESCQVGFGPYFYTTWIGYMNSFMNPIIYTIFNTEFRRAFKSLIFGRSSRNAHFQSGYQRGQRVHV